MVNYAIFAFSKVVKSAGKKLSEVQKRGVHRQIVNAEEELCLETRSLLSKYKDLVLWAGEMDKATFNLTRNTMQFALQEIGCSETDAANAIRRQWEEFNAFVRDEQIVKKLARDSRMLSLSSEKDFASGKLKTL